jgi:hypothetical protein
MIYEISHNDVTEEWWVAPSTELSLSLTCFTLREVGVIELDGIKTYILFLNRKHVMDVFIDGYQLIMEKIRLDEGVQGFKYYLDEWKNNDIDSYTEALGEINQGNEGEGFQIIKNFIGTKITDFNYYSRNKVISEFLGNENGF